MTKRVNKYGLNRRIPESVKRIVRQKSGFGCVVCGSAFYQYEHIYPTFAEAKEHDPDAMTLLCGGCHDRVTRKHLSKESVKRFARNPVTKRRGFSFGLMDLDPDNYSIVLGSVFFLNPKEIIAVQGVTAISLRPPEDDGEPMRLTAVFPDQDGNPILALINNEWRISTLVNDAQTVGSKTIIRYAGNKKKIILESERNVIKFSRLTLSVMGKDINISEESGIVLPGGGGFHNIAIDGSQAEKSLINVDMELTDAEMGSWLNLQKAFD